MFHCAGASASLWFGMEIGAGDLQRDGTLEDWEIEQREMGAYGHVWDDTGLMDDAGNENPMMTSPGSNGGL